MNYLVRHRANLAPELREDWAANGYKTSGTWEEVFGPGRPDSIPPVPAEERDTAWHKSYWLVDAIFMAWRYSMYVNKVAPLGGIERDQKGGRRAGDEGGLRRAGFQPLAVPVDDRKQSHGRGAARSQLQRRLHSRRPRGPHGAQSQHVDLPAQHADWRGFGEHPAIRRHHAECRSLDGVRLPRRRQEGNLVHAEFRNQERRDPGPHRPRHGRGIRPGLREESHRGKSLTTRSGLHFTRTFMFRNHVSDE